MTYEEAIDFLFNSLPVWEQKGAEAYKPGLERIAAFADAVGLGGDLSTAPFSRKRYIHVAGTNGKGSTCHMLAAVLQKAGVRTGLFTSPHLVDFRERIRVDGRMIPEEAVVEFTERYRDEMVRAGLTFFEMATAMALWWFGRAGCGAAVIEAGLGGRLDSTNIVTPVVSVITNIGLEHTQYLGDTVAAIAAEKAGIIKPGVPVVIGETDPESEPVFRARAAETGSEIVFADRVTPGEGRAFRLDLAGDYQQKNLATVLATVEVLRRTFGGCLDFDTEGISGSGRGILSHDEGGVGVPTASEAGEKSTDPESERPRMANSKQPLTIPDDALCEGLAHAAALTGLAGRWQVVRRDPLVVLDTAHNAHGLAEVARQIARQKYERLYMVLGFAGDKDLSAIVRLLPRDAHYILTRAATPRAADEKDLAERFVREGVAAERIETAASVPAALRRATELAGPDDMVFVGGSNFVVGEAVPLLCGAPSATDC